MEKLAGPPRSRGIHGMQRLSTRPLGPSQWERRGGNCTATPRFSEWRVGDSCRPRAADVRLGAPGAGGAVAATSGASRLSHPQDPTPACVRRSCLSAPFCSSPLSAPTSPEPRASPARAGGGPRGRGCLLKGSPAAARRPLPEGRRGLQRLPRHHGQAGAPRLLDFRLLPSEFLDSRNLDEACIFSPQPI